MNQNEYFKPFFKNARTTNAVLTVIVRVDRGCETAESINYAAEKYAVDVQDIDYYWNAISKQERWFKH